MHNKELSIPLAIIVAGAMIAAAVFFGGSAGSPGGTLTNNRPTNNAPTGKVEPVGAQDRIFGNPDAEITVVEYSDLECPFCKSFHNTMHQVVSEYNGKVNWVYRHFPIASLHSRAIKEAEASECAFEQGGSTAFWNYIDKVFATTQANNSLDPAQLPIIANQIGLDVTEFNTCLSSGRYTKKINDDVTKAVAAGAQGTPYSVIIAGDKQVVINGAEPIDSVRLKIDSLLE